MIKKNKNSWTSLKTKPPYKFDQVKKSQWLESYKKSRSFTRACQSVDIHPDTVYTALKNDKDLNDKKIAIDEIVTDIVENRAFALTETSTAMAIFWLCNRRPEQWRNVQMVDIAKDGALARMLLVRPPKEVKVIEEPSMLTYERPSSHNGAGA